MSGQLLISVVIPCRNEEDFIASCLDAVIANDYPHDRLEVLVVDGMSEDSSRQIIEDYSVRNPYIRLIDNPGRITPKALNIGVRAARGDIIIRMDAHAGYDTNFIPLCVKHLESTGADNVGGIMVTLPQTDSLMGRAIVAALTSSFGVGNSTFRVGTDQPVEVDTVFGGCFRADVFERIGLFNEDLRRGQDLEFNLRIKRSGGRILLVPDIVSTYFARSTLSGFIHHNWTNGVWALLPFRHTDIMPVGLRHLAPMSFMFVLMGSLMGSLAWPPLLVVFASTLGAYAIAAVVASVSIAAAQRSALYALTMPLAFASLHFPYGLGSLWGALCLLFSGGFWKKQVLRRLGF